VYPTNYYIALGTNVGNYKNNFIAAIRELNKLGQISKIADIYKSKPYGYLYQNYFYNSVLELKSKMMPMQLMKNIQLIEKKLQKNKRIINGPRKIDLDIIFWGKKKLRNHNLYIPHPRAKERDFVLLPLIDLDPFFRDPETQLTIKDLLDSLKDHYVIKRLSYSNLF
jgi:2-amino-4-hydroxy-6-hydroxymethyldihydropteridine diphosphokinase